MKVDLVGSLFQQGLKYETEQNWEKSAQCYEQVLLLNPRHVAAWVNLGTLHYHRRRLPQARECYEAALRIDSTYALAHFDLANVLDDQGLLVAAFEHYKRAIELLPQYADAHYNLAHLLERMNKNREALAHWTIYRRLDHKGQWHDQAVERVRELLKSEKLQVVWENPKPRRTKRRAKLRLE